MPKSGVPLASTGHLTLSPQQQTGVALDQYGSGENSPCPSKPLGDDLRDPLSVAGRGSGNGPAPAVRDVKLSSPGVD